MNFMRTHLTDGTSPPAGNCVHCLNFNEEDLRGFEASSICKPGYYTPTFMSRPRHTLYLIKEKQ